MNNSNQQEWKECKLGEHVLINSRTVDKNYPYEEIEYLDTGSITKGKIESLQHFKLSDAPSRARRIAKDSDIVLSMVRPIQRHYGYLRNPQPNTVVSTGFAVLTNKETIDPYFLYSFLTQDEITDYLDAVAEGSTSAYPAFTPDLLENLSIPLPPLPEQRAIAGVLSSLDDKIDLLHRQNKTLEGMAEALWRKMFVEEADPGWKRGRFGDICERITKGTTPTTLKRNFVNTGINFIKAESIDDEGNFIPDKFAHIDQETNKLLARSIIQENDILYTIAGTIGRTAVVTREILPANTNQAVAIIRLNSPDMFVCYARLLLKTSAIINDLNSKVVHAVQPNLSLGMISETEILIPNEQILIAFNAKCSPLFLKRRQNTTQIGTLSRLRDTLLPKLMSGGVRVKV